ncbi:hypothetical protein Saso_44160 [Streptomyces asoensis]|uniref:Uncharacterized protein n=1 Tax=Streptomyces asoensis TaxID=249586 RepID=A0ABQ3S3R9_9ACTN|nr:hypothetical protein GCM10010496_51770 [Streptomyces asoensis]GHI62766.1 hypothetical protein Saso_44160 [Streptomyces asoensis]
MSATIASIAWAEPVTGLSWSRGGRTTVQSVALRASSASIARRSAASRADRTVRVSRAATPACLRRRAEPGQDRVQRAFAYDAAGERPRADVFAARLARTLLAGVAGEELRTPASRPHPPAVSP